MFTKAVVGAMTALATLTPMECAQRAGDRSCPQHEATLEAFAPEAGWDVTHMSRIMWRESRCDPTAWNARGRASGLLQITPVSYPYLRGALGEWVDRWTLQDPEQNVRASAALFDYWARVGRSGYQPWRL